MDATIIITTKNRREELTRALSSCLTQTGATIEVMVLDDGSTDGTAEMVRQAFPSVRLERSEESRGYIVRRNSGTRLARGRVVFSIDDDAAFTDAHTVAATLAWFSHERVGAVALPFVDVLRSPAVQQEAPPGSSLWVAAEYRGTAYAVRRDLFNTLGGYREVLLHQGEERDYCVRMLQAGFVVVAGRSAPIHHFESPKRDLTRQMTYGARNNLLFAWHNTPMPALLWHAPGTAALTLVNAARLGYGLMAARGLVRAATDTIMGRVNRQPVSRATYALHQALRRAVATPIERVAKELGPMRAGALKAVGA